MDLETSLPPDPRPVGAGALSVPFLSLDILVSRLAVAHCLFLATFSILVPENPMTVAKNSGHNHPGVEVGLRVVDGRVGCG